MKNLNLIYRLAGDEEKIRNGLNVFEIAPILLSVGSLITEANKTLYPDGNEIAVNVKPFKNGSFIIDIVLFAKNNFNDLLSFTQKDQVKQIKELLEWMGIIYTGIGINYTFLGAIKYLKGKPKSVEKLSENEIRYTGQDNTTITVNKPVHQLFQNCTIQTVVYNAFGKPLEQDGIELVETYLENEPLNPVIITQEDAKNLKDFSSFSIPSLETEETVSNPMKAYLSPKRGSYDGDPRQWSFRMGDAVIIATIKDEDFIAKCKSGEIRLNHKDVLWVELTQKIKKINDRLDSNSISFEVEKVLDYQIGSPSIQHDMLRNDN